MGKYPLLRSWERFQRTAATPQQIEEWFSAGEPAANIGVVTGRVSGLVVVDTDSAEAEAWAALHLPITPWRVKTSKGWHRYYRHPGVTVNNRARVRAEGANGKKLALDVRGDGGYVVGPFSQHASGAIYEPSNWLWTKGETLPLFSLSWIEQAEAMAAPRAAIQQPRVNLPAPTGNGHAPALSRATRDFLDNGAAEGERNDRLFRAAADMRGCHWTRRDAETQLLLGARLSGLPDGEARATIASAFSRERAPARGAGAYNGGAARRRTTTVHVGAVESNGNGNGAHIQQAAAQPPPDTRPIVLLPGEHPDGAVIVEQSNHTFAEQIIEALPGDSIYIRGDVAGQIVKTCTPRDHAATVRFSTATIERVRLLVDKHVRLGRRVVQRDGGDRWRYSACTDDAAKIVRDVLSTSPKFRVLSALTTVPAFYRDSNGNLAALRPGWNDACGVYRDASATEQQQAAQPLALDPDDNDTRERVHGMFLDLLRDFPFEAPADAENFVALLLTAMLRPAIEGNTPIFLCQAAQPRSGKTKLLSTVLGMVIYGRPLPTTACTGDEAELEKRVLAWLAEGAETILLDNIEQRRELDSAVLAQLATSPAYHGRILGQTRTVTYPSRALILATGNNPRLSGELASRTIPIRLAPDTPTPEARVNFAHSNLPAYLRAERAQIISTLQGMVLGHQVAVLTGRAAASKIVLGGFEEWAGLIGGILATWGFTEAATNRAAWRNQAAATDSAINAFMAAWWRAHGESLVTRRELLKIALGLDECPSARLDKQTTERGQLMAIGRMICALNSRVFAYENTLFKVQDVGEIGHGNMNMAKLTKV